MLPNPPGYQLSDFFIICKKHVNTMYTILSAGLEYLRLGLSIVPAALDKHPIVAWRRYQTTPMSESVWEAVAGLSATQAIGIVCGRVSGHLEVLDIDTKHDLSGALFGQFELAIRNHLPACWSRLVIARTVNAGYHVYYRCPLAGRNAVLARRPLNAVEQEANPDNKAFVLIETRGNGGYVLADPTPGYRFIQGAPSLIPVLDAVERDALLAIAASFNAYYPQAHSVSQATGPVSRAGSPLDDYDRRGDAIGLLVRHGWTVVDSDADRTYLRRPGNTTHDRSGDFHHRLNRFGVFSTNTPFEVGKSYRPCAVYAILECGGDFRLAANVLSSAGFGIPYKNQAA